MHFFYNVFKVAHLKQIKVGWHVRSFTHIRFLCLSHKKMWSIFVSFYFHWIGFLFAIHGAQQYSEREKERERENERCDPMNILCLSNAAPKIKSKLHKVIDCTVKPIFEHKLILIEKKWTKCQQINQKFTSFTATTKSK